MQLLEKEKKLSESLLWQLQYNAYTQFGPKAWSHKGVPFYVTSNPYTANSYAQVVYGFIKDNPLYIDDEPLYILDLGAGSGRFAYLFLKEFLSIIEDTPLHTLSFRFVLTDIAKENFAFWQNHPLLKEYFEKGILDYCYYHHAQEEKSLTLARSGEKIANTKNPLILLANYFFDTIPQDLFRVKDGNLEEGFISLYTSKKFSDPHDPEIINDLSWEYTFTPIDDVESLYPDTPSYREFLLSYQKNLHNATFLFPVGALQTLDYFKMLSNGNMLLVAGDQGVANLEQIADWEPKLSLHGSFSIAVSYYTLASYFEENLGQSFLTKMPDPAFVVMAGILSQDRRTFYETEFAFRNFIDAFEPQDYWRLGIEMEKSQSSLEAILLLIKLGKFDPMNAYGFYNAIRKEIPFASRQLKQRLAYTLEQVEKNFFPVASEDGGFLANLGVLFFDMHKYGQALALFQKAVHYEGRKEYLINNIKACLSKLT